MPTPDDGGLWGVLGGTFDPVHRGHLSLATELLRECRLDGVLFVPAFNHPQKKERATAPLEDRLTMLELAVGEEDRFLIDRIEISEKLSGYSLDTVRALKQTYPEATFAFLVGQDNLSQLSHWHSSEQLLAEVQFIAGARPGNSAADSKHVSQVKLVSTVLVEISSTQVRKCVANGASDSELDQLVPQSVREYIRHRGLYQ